MGTSVSAPITLTAPGWVPLSAEVELVPGWVLVRLADGGVMRFCRRPFLAGEVVKAWADWCDIVDQNHNIIVLVDRIVRWYDAEGEEVLARLAERAA